MEAKTQASVADALSKLRLQSNELNEAITHIETLNQSNILASAQLIKRCNLAQKLQQ